MIILIESRVIRKTWDGIHYTVQVPVGTDKLMMTAVRDFTQREPKAAQCVTTFDRDVHTGQRRWNNSTIGQVMQPMPACLI